MRQNNDSLEDLERHAERRIIFYLVFSLIFSSQQEGAKGEVGEMKEPSRIFSMESPANTLALESDAVFHCSSFFTSSTSFVLLLLLRPCFFLSIGGARCHLGDKLRPHRYTCSCALVPLLWGTDLSSPHRSPTHMARSTLAETQ